MSKYLRYGGYVFSRHKVLTIRTRNSFFYIWNPYVMEVAYQKHWMKTYYINFGGKISNSIPIQTSHHVMDFKFVFPTQEEVRRDVKLFEDCPNVEIIDDIDK